MSVTAARLGASPLLLDWSNLRATQGGTSPATLQAAWAALRARFGSGEVGFYQAPIDPAISQIKESTELASKFRGRGMKDVLFLGIGGSSLGPLSLLAALKHRTQSEPCFHFVENPDPTDWRLTLSKLSPESTLVCIVTKSGTTFETMAQALLALEWLGRDRWKTQVVAITDPAKGDLLAFAKSESIPTLAIHPSLGGRFSVFSPVGLFAASLAGLDTTAFLQGAAQVREHAEKTPIEKNPLALIGAELIRQFGDRPIHVCMPYSTPLRLIGDWWVQLWAESLGKDGKGFTAVGALGATDQHSILQLLRDGPDDKITWFMTVDQVEDEVRIPKLATLTGGMPHASPAAFRILEGHTLHELLRVEQQSIAQVLTRRGRPHLTWKLERLDERNLGAVMFGMALGTAITGHLWGVNPFDQPGVEEGKVYIQEHLRNAPSVAVEDDENSPVNRLRRPPRETSGEDSV